MKTKAFIINMGLITLFYLLGTSLTIVLLNYYSFTFSEVAVIMYIMAIVSFVLFIYHIIKLIKTELRIMNYVLVIILIIMAVLLTLCANSLSEPWELPIF